MQGAIVLIIRFLTTSHIASNSERAFIRAAPHLGPTVGFSPRLVFIVR